MKSDEGEMIEDKADNAPPHTKGWRRRCCCYLECFTSCKSARKVEMVYNHPSAVVGNGPSITTPRNAANYESAIPSPAMGVPPCSPASIMNSENTSLAESPATGRVHGMFGSSFAFAPANGGKGIFQSTNKDFSLLLTPPLLSTLTTAPTTPLSTAPFTPPPELAHLTSPPSPELPFAELVGSEGGGGIRPVSSIPSDLAFQLHPGSPIGHSFSAKSPDKSPTILPLQHHIDFTLLNSKPYNNAFHHGGGCILDIDDSETECPRGLDEAAKEKNSSNLFCRLISHCHKGQPIHHTLTEKVNSVESLSPLPTNSDAFSSTSGEHGMSNNTNSEEATASSVVDTGNFNFEGTRECISLLPMITSVATNNTQKTPDNNEHSSIYCGLSLQCEALLEALEQAKENRVSIDRIEQKEREDKTTSSGT